MEDQHDPIVGYKNKKMDCNWRERTLAHDADNLIIVRSLLEEIKECEEEGEDYILMLFCCWLNCLEKMDGENNMGIVMSFLLLLEQMDEEEDLLVELLERSIIWQSEVDRVDAIMPANYSEFKVRTVAELSEIDCREWTRFKKDELLDLLPRLRLPEFFEVKINERTWQLPGEFVCMFSLTRLAKGESYNDLHLKFGSNRDFMGSFFFVFVRHIYCHFFHKISGRSMEMWMDDKMAYFRKLV